MQVAALVEEKNNLMVQVKNQERALQSGKRRISELQAEKSRLEKEIEEMQATPLKQVINHLYRW